MNPKNDKVVCRDFLVYTTKKVNKIVFGELNVEPYKFTTKYFQGKSKKIQISILGRLLSHILNHYKLLLPAHV